jgi:predicted ATPase/tetratricopeptide (TPR) repeat protein
VRPTPPDTERRIGRYLLVRTLGRGGAGEVWEAVLQGPHGFRKDVAVKVLHAGPADADGRAGLVREARLGGLLSHPNVVATLELGEDGGVWFVAMELVHGASVLELARRGPLSAPALVDLGLQACAALSHVHALRADGAGAGLIHRDVKPQNLLVDRNGLVKLADLGIARFAGASGGTSGTPGYMAPEQAAGREDTRADLFALGATLFVAATGLRPFGTGVQAVHRVAHVEDLLVDPAFLAPADRRLPGLGEVLRSCLRRDPDARFQRAADLASALRALRVGPGPSLVELLVQARPELAPEASRAWTPPVGEATVLRAPRGNLPPARDRFVGRGEVVAGLAGEVAAGRVHTVVGAGGMGKTRVALEVARTLEARFPGGAWFCDLSEARTPAGVAAAVAQVFGIPLVTAEPGATVGHALASRGAALVVLDNFEQVAHHALATVGAWRTAAPDLAWLVTSQRPLQLAGEVLVPLEPLALAPAVELFQARAVRPPTPAERPQVEALVARLDGMPLAIELAAARTRLLTVDRIHERLLDRFRLLAGGGPERPARHRSLRASLDGSWELLAPHAQRGLARLSVFAGGFALEAAEAVLDGDADAPWALDVLTELAEASLLLVEGEHFRMLVGIQQYAEGHLTGAERAEAERRHGAHFARQTSPPGPDDLENLVLACRRAVVRGDVAVAAATAIAACRRLEDVGPFAVALGLADAALTLDLSSADAAVLLRLRARLLGFTGRTLEALAAAEQGLTSARAVGEAEGVAQSALEVADHLRVLGRSGEALALAEEAVQLGRAGPVTLASALLSCGTIAMHLGRYPEAATAFDEALATSRSVGDLVGEGAALACHASLHTDQGRYREAQQICEAAVALQRRTGNRRREASALANLGLAESHLGHTEAAREALEQARALHAALGDRRGEATDLSHLARVHLTDGRTEEARAALQASITYSRAAQDAPRLGPTLIQLAVLEHIAGCVPEARATYEEALAVAEGAQEARFAAQAAMNYGVLLVDNGELARGAALLDRAQQAYARLGLVAGRALTLANLGAALVEAGRPEEGRQRLEEALTVGRGCTSAWALGNALVGLGDFLLDHAGPEAALPVLEEGAQVLATLGRASAGRARALLARCHRERGDLVRAQEVLAFSDGETTYQDTTVPAWTELARLQLAQGRAADAVDAASRAIELATSFPPLGAQANCVLALARSACGDLAGAQAAVLEAARLVERSGSAPGTPLQRELARTRAALVERSSGG